MLRAGGKFHLETGDGALLEVELAAVRSGKQRGRKMAETRLMANQGELAKIRARTQRADH